MRAATGELVHPTVASFLDYHPHPGLVILPVRDLPPSTTAMLWRRGTDSAKVRAFAQVAPPYPNSAVLS